MGTSVDLIHARIAHDRLEAAAEAKRNTDRQLALDAIYRIERYLKSARFPEAPRDGVFRDPDHVAEAVLQALYRCHGGKDGFYPDPAELFGTEM